MNIESIQAYFDQNPLGSDEQRGESTIRLVRCTRASRYTLAWIFVYAQQGTIETEVMLEPTGLICSFFKNAKSYSGSVEEFYDEEHRLWSAKEFEIVTPYLLPPFTVKCNNTKRKVSRAARKRLLNTYWRSISHATRCKGYAEWAKENRQKRLSACQDNLSIEPLISIITPAYETPPKLLEEMMQSVQNQTYQNWEHIIVNASPENKEMTGLFSKTTDTRVKLVTLEKNKGIVGNTNAGIKVAQGDYISFLDHDDLLEEDALYWIARTVEASDREVDLINCDEDSIDERGVVQTPRLKPPLNLDLLYANNYFLHLLTISRRVIEGTSRSDDSVEGAQDYDVTLKATGIAKKCVRIPEILYHWRSHRGSTNSNPDSKTYSDYAGQTSLQSHFDRIGLATEVHRRRQLFTYHSEFLLTNDSWPNITCIIVGTSMPTVLRKAIDEYIEAAPGELPKVDVVYCEGTSVSERIKKIKDAQGDLLLFVSSDMQELTPRFLQTLAGYFQRAEVAVVAPKVIRSDDLIDYAGIAVRPNGELMRLNRFMFEGARTFLDRPTHPYDALVVNAEYFMVHTSSLRECSLDQSYETMDYALADICVQFYESDKLNVFTPFAGVKQKNYKSALAFCDAQNAVKDIALFTSRHGAIFQDNDPSHNPNFDPYSPYYLLRDYVPVSSDGLTGHLWYLTKRTWHILKNNGIRNMTKTVKRYLLKRQS